MVGLNFFDVWEIKGSWGVRRKWVDLFEGSLGSSKGNYRVMGWRGEGAVIGWEIDQSFLMKTGEPCKRPGLSQRDPDLPSPSTFTDERQEEERDRADFDSDAI